MTKLIASLSLAILLASLPATDATGQARPGDTALRSRIDSLIRGEADSRLVSGIVLVARGDHIMFQRGYGHADWERLVPNTPATRVGIGSITKSMTEIVVAQLASEGRLELDASVSRYLGDFPKGPGGGEVTVRHLLEHRSGIPWRVTKELEETESPHPADIVERVRRTGLLFEPGTKELYSSAGFTCLARVVEVIEGKPFDVVLRQRVFWPAAMRSATGETGPELMMHRALAYRLGVTADTSGLGCDVEPVLRAHHQWIRVVDRLRSVARPDVRLSGEHAVPSRIRSSGCRSETCCSGARSSPSTVRQRWRRASRIRVLCSDHMAILMIRSW